MRCSRKLIGLMILTGTALGAGAQEELLKKDRAWLDKQGRGVEGHIVQYDAHKNSIQFLSTNGKRVWVKPDDFSKKDGQYIQEWILANYFLTNSKLQIAVDKKTKSGRVSYALKFKNRSSRKIPAFKLEYKFLIEVESYSGSDQERWKSGSLSINALAPGASAVRTISSGVGGSEYKEVSVATTDHYGYTTYSKEKQKVSTTYTRGVLLRLQGPSLEDTPIVRSLSEPASLGKKHSWYSAR